MKLIVGLGNPGGKYSGTRHNVGYEVVDELARRWRISLEAEKFHAWFGRGEIDAEPVVLLKPMTYMNESGRAVAAAGRFYKLELSDLLVIADDFALPLGTIRLRPRGSAGSHKGLQSVMDRLGTDQWCRLRIGIGEALGDPTVFVLGRFEGAEGELIRQVQAQAADAAQCWIKDGIDLAMTRFNGERLGDSGSGTRGDNAPTR